MAITSPDISKTWMTQTPASASEWPSIAVITCDLRGFAPRASFGLTLTLSMHRLFAAKSGQILALSRSNETQNRNSDYLNPRTDRCSAQSMGSERLMSRSRFKSIGWVPSRIASVMSGASSANGMTLPIYVRGSFSALAMSVIDRALRFLSISNH